MEPATSLTEGCNLRYDRCQNHHPEYNLLEQTKIPLVPPDSSSPCFSVHLPTPLSLLHPLSLSGSTRSETLSFTKPAPPSARPLLCTPVRRYPLSEKRPRPSATPWVLPSTPFPSTRRVLPLVSRRLSQSHRPPSTSTTATRKPRCCNERAKLSRSFTNTL